MPKKNKNIPYSSYEGKEISFEQIKKGDLIKIYYKIADLYEIRFVIKIELSIPIGIQLYSNNRKEFLKEYKIFARSEKSIVKYFCLTNLKSSNS